MKHFALIGDPVAHSLSPLIYGVLFAHYCIDADFSLLRIPRGREADVFSCELDGFACTMPHKQAIMRHLSEISPEAMAMGSVNIVKKAPQGYIGYSTDGDGLRAAILRNHAIANKQVFIIGSGGAARSAAYALAKDAAVSVFARNQAARDELSAALGVRAAPLCALSSEASACDILINATPQGMRGHAGFASFDFVDALKSDALVCDMVYEPRNTTLLSAARARGLDTLEGVSMLIGQALAAFKIWTGTAPDTDLLNELLYIKINEGITHRG